MGTAIRGTWDEYDTAPVARKSLTQNVSVYNGRSPRIALDRQTPDTARETSRRSSDSGKKRSRR